MNLSLFSCVYKGIDESERVAKRTAEALLVVRAQGGCSASFGVLYRSYGPSLVRFAYKLSGNKQLAEDAVQDAWVTTARTLQKLEEPEGFRAWIFKAVRWRTLDYLRKKSFKDVPLENAEDIAGGNVDTLATGGQIQALISQLPAIEQQAIHLFYIEELSLTEISEIISVPVGTLKSRLNRARGRLQAMAKGDIE